MNNTNRKYLVDGVATIRLPKVMKYYDSTGNELIPVVRCKDCEFYDKDEKWCRRLGLCGAFDENGFCSHGERRKDD